MTSNTTRRCARRQVKRTAVYFGPLAFIYRKYMFLNNNLRFTQWISGINLKSITVRVMAALAPALLLAACAVGPDYKRPQVVAPPAYKASKDWKIAEPKDVVPRGMWWMFLGDPLLNELAEKIEVSNQDLRFAEAQYRRAQALTRQARAGLMPTVTGDVGVARSGRGGRSPETNYDLSGRLSWDADLWGRVRKSVEAGAASEAASAAELESVRLALQSELVLNYLQLRVLDRSEERRVGKECA